MKQPKKPRPPKPFHPHLGRPPQKKPPQQKPFAAHLGRGVPARPQRPQTFHAHLGQGGGAQGGAGKGGGGGKKQRRAPRLLRGSPLAGGVACCAAEALAASLRLTSRPVTDADVLALYRRTVASGWDDGTTIEETLEEALACGLSGVYPVSFEPVDLDDPAAVLLGVDLPGSHTVCVDAGGWWSWGELYDPGAWPDAVIEEAWAVAW